MLTRTTLLSLALAGLILSGPQRRPDGFRLSGMLTDGRAFAGDTPAESLEFQAVLPDGSIIPIITTMNPHWTSNRVVLELEPDGSGAGQILRSFGWTAEVASLAGHVELTGSSRASAPLDVADFSHLRIEHLGR